MLIAQDLREFVRFGPSNELHVLLLDAAKWVNSHRLNVYDIEVKRDGYTYTISVYWR